MKTTVVLPDELMRKAKLRAKREGLSLTRFIEAAVTERLQKAGAPVNRQVKITPFQGTGYVSDHLEGNWHAIRNLLYESE